MCELVSSDPTVSQSVRRTLNLLAILSGPTLFGVIYVDVSIYHVAVVVVLELGHMCNCKRKICK